MIATKLFFIETSHEIGAGGFCFGAAIDRLAAQSSSRSTNSARPAGLGLAELSYPARVSAIVEQIYRKMTILSIILKKMIILSVLSCISGDILGGIFVRP
jgi:hypothetical protein